VELRPGYKKTEVGAVPEEWEIHTIGSSMRLINGRAFRPEDWKDRGLPIIRIQNLNDADVAFNHYPGTVEDRHRVEAGDLLFAWSGTTGTSFGARVWSGPSGILNQHIFKVLPDRRKLSDAYALLVLRQVQEQVEKQAHGFKASFVHVKKSDLIGVQLPLPSSTAEQQAIAEARLFRRMGDRQPRQARFSVRWTYGKDRTGLWSRFSSLRDLHERAVQRLRRLRVI